VHPGASSVPSVAAGGARAGTRRRHPAPVSPSLKALGERVKAARVEAGLSQAQLGAPHFTRAYVSAVELGKIRPAVKSLEFLAGRLGKPLSFFLEDRAEERRRREREFEVLRAKELIARGQGREARDLLEPLLQQELSSLDAAHLRRLLGLACHTAREGADAVAHLTASVEILERVGSVRELRRARRDLAAALLEAGAADRALAIYRQLLESTEADSPRDPLFRMQVLRGLGATYSMLGDSPAAIAYYEQALHYARDVGDLISLGRIYSGLGYGYWLSGDYEAATSNMQRAISTHQAAHDVGTVAELHNNLAVLCLERSHFGRAKEHLAEARQLALTAGRPAILASLTNTEAEIAIGEGRLDDALSILEKARALAEERGLKRSLAATLKMLGRVAALQRRLTDARISLEDAAEIFMEVRMNAAAAECLYELSRLLTDSGDPSGAARFAARAYEVSRSRKGGS
jgi:tetratricopeptide (TPR) repeat protein